MSRGKRGIRSKRNPQGIRKGAVEGAGSPFSRIFATSSSKQGKFRASGLVRLSRLEIGLSAMSEDTPPQDAPPPPPAPPAGGRPAGAEKKVVAGVLGILIGALGIHKFYLGYTKEGIIHICLNLVCLAGIIGLIEGIIYLTKSDEEFVETYVKGHKGWF